MCKSYRDDGALRGAFSLEKKRTNKKTMSSGQTYSGIRWPVAACAKGIDRFHSRGKQLCKFVGTKTFFYITKVSIPNGYLSVHQHGRRFHCFIHQYGHRDVRWKRSITAVLSFSSRDSLDIQQNPLGFPLFKNYMYRYVYVLRLI